MANGSYGTALRHVHALFNVGIISGLTDGQLLDRFTSGDQETAELAFAAIVERHGPMVLRVCQSVLRERHDADDAFQATFLILVRKAASIRKQNSVVSWLHGTAFRVASCQRAAKSRRHRHERTVADRAAAPSFDEDQEERASVLHDELDRLPEKYRTPLVLCYFEGLSHEQAARQLCWPVGTVRSRLARGREQLRGRLMRRGLATSLVVLEKALRAEKASAAISPALASAIARAALHYASAKFVATGITSTSVALLIEGAMNVMFLTKMKLALLTVGLIATGTLVAARQVGTVVPSADAQAASAAEADSQPPRSRAADEDAIVARELGRLDLELLAEEVRQLRNQVEVTLRDKLRAERKNPGEARAAQSAFEAARASYLDKARELRTAERRPGIANGPRETGPPESADLSTAGADRARGEPTARTPEPGPSAAAIGTIDMDAVWARYEKVKASKKEYNSALTARKTQLMKIMDEAQDEARMLPKLEPGSEDYQRHENRVAVLKARHEAGREQAEREFAQRHAEATATLYKEIQDTVAAIAKAKRLNYVVKLAQDVRPGSSSTDLDTALKSSAVFADRRNDITEEIIHDLNQKFQAAGAKISS